jgi:hypothetical protein
MPWAPAFRWARHYSMQPLIQPIPLHSGESAAACVHAAIYSAAAELASMRRFSAWLCRVTPAGLKQQMLALAPAFWLTGAVLHAAAQSYVWCSTALVCRGAAARSMSLSSCVTQCSRLAPLQGGRGRLPAARAAGAQPVRAVPAALCCCPPSDTWLPVQGVPRCWAVMPLHLLAGGTIWVLTDADVHASHQAPRPAAACTASESRLRFQTVTADCGVQGVPAHEHRQPQGGERPHGSKVLWAGPAGREEPQVCKQLLLALQHATGLRWSGTKMLEAEASLGIIAVPRSSGLAASHHNQLTVHLSFRQSHSTLVIDPAQGRVLRCLRSVRPDPLLRSARQLRPHPAAAAGDESRVARRGVPQGHSSDALQVAQRGAAEVPRLTRCWRFLSNAMQHRA